MPEETEAGTIQVRVERPAQLFNMLDPYPFRERDLATEAEDYIVGWARELPKDQPIRIVVRLADAGNGDARGIGEAFAHYFRYRADGVARDLRELFRIGRLSLVIGILALAVCVTLSQAVIAVFGPTPSAELVQEGLIIIGWVANWRPLEIFLYDWWPLARRRRLYLRLAKAEVTVTQDTALG